MSSRRGLIVSRKLIMSAKKGLLKRNKSSCNCRSKFLPNLHPNPLVKSHHWAPNRTSQFRSIVGYRQNIIKLLFKNCFIIVPILQWIQNIWMLNNRKRLWRPVKSRLTALLQEDPRGVQRMTSSNKTPSKIWKLSASWKLCHRCLTKIAV